MGTTTSLYPQILISGQCWTTAQQIWPSTLLLCSLFDVLAISILGRGYES
jgi:hypothetical protein